METNLESLCMGCMRHKGDAQVCRECGFEEGTPPERPGQLWPRTVLAEKYVVGRVLGQGGFGITYLAWDLLLDRKLAIKEHFPREICSRGRDERTVQPLTQRLTEDYGYGLRKFVEEGRAMARFYDYPGIVLLLDFFEANGTAYIVMAYVAGMTFKQYLDERGGSLGFDPALDILIPVMDALREVHRMGMLHRDVSPDNIYINEKKQVKILDFGSTRYAVREVSQMPAVKPGYSPFEQYSSSKQGTWTDVYATAATFYCALTGKTPPIAPDRLERDSLVPPSRLGIKIPAASEKALLKALSVQAKDRFQTMKDFQDAIVPKKGIVPNEIVLVDNGEKKPPGGRWSTVYLVAACFLLLTSLGFSALWVQARRGGRYNSSEALMLRNQVEELQKSLAEQQKSVADQRTQSDALQTKVNTLDQQNQALTTRLNTLNGERSAWNGQRTALNNQLAAAEAEATNLRAQIKGLQELTNNLQAQLNARKISVTYSRFYYWDGNPDLKRSKLKAQEPAEFAGNSLRYLLCVLQGPNPLQGKQFFSAAIDVRYFAPDGTLKYVDRAGVESPSNVAGWSAHSGWGSDQPGFFQRGNWRVEVWFEGQRIAQIGFRVY